MWVPWMRAPPCGISWRRFVDAVLDPQEAVEGMAEDNTAAADMVSSCIPLNVHTEVSRLKGRAGVCLKQHAGLDLER